MLTYGYICSHIYTYPHLHIYIHMNTHAYICLHTSMCTHIDTHTHNTHVHTWPHNAHAYMYLHTFTHAHINIHMKTTYIYICTHIYLLTHSYRHVLYTYMQHVHTQINIPTHTCTHLLQMRKKSPPYKFSQTLGNTSLQCYEPVQEHRRKDQVSTFFV